MVSVCCIRVFDVKGGMLLFVCFCYVHQLRLSSNNDNHHNLVSDLIYISEVE